MITVVLSQCVRMIFKFTYSLNISELSHRKDVFFERLPFSVEQNFGSFLDYLGILKRF